MRTRRTPLKRYVSSTLVLVPRFPFCRGEACLVVTPMYGYFCNLFPLVPVVGSTFLPPLPFSDLSSHSPPILAVVFLVFCNLIASLSRIFSVISRLSFDTVLPYLPSGETSHE